MDNPNWICQHCVLPQTQLGKFPIVTITLAEQLRLMVESEKLDQVFDLLAYMEQISDGLAVFYGIEYYTIFDEEEDLYFIISSVDFYMQYGVKPESAAIDNTKGRFEALLP